MTSGTRNLVLRFAGVALLFAPTALAQAQGVGRPVCRDVLVPGRVGGIASNEHAHYERVCDSVYYPPPAAAPPAPEPPVMHTTGSETTVHYDAAAEARKAQLRATTRQDPRSSLCPPPHRMTARDGCQ
jgi:hypothetical protein